jgi:hypothetical protein
VKFFAGVRFFRATGEKVKVVTMVHLAGGTNHIIQHDAHTTVQVVLDKRATFDGHVAELIATNDFALLTEEFSKEARKKAHASATTLQRLANEKGIEHRFCAPNSIERKEQGIDNDNKRERFWLDQIKGCKDCNILFVCGDKHFDAFAAKLIGAGFDVQCGRRGAHQCR